MEVCSGERKRINICTVRASHVRVFESREAAREKARSAHLRDPYPPLVVQIRSRDQSPRRNSGIESTVNNSSITLSCISISLSLPLAIFFFFGATWLSRRRCIDSSASIRSTIYAATVLCLPRSFFFLPFPFFVRHRKRQREHKPLDYGMHRAGREGTRPFSNLSRVRGGCVRVSAKG